MEDDLNIFLMEDDLNNFGMEDKYNIFENGRRPKKIKATKTKSN